MKELRIPSGVWNWRGTALVLVLALAPLLATLTLLPDGEVLATALHARSLLVGTAILAAGVFLYLHWRITTNETTGWLALLLAVAAIPAMALGAFSLTHLETVETQDGWLFAFRVVILLGLLGTVLAARLVPLRGDPLAIGLVVGMAIAGARQVVLVEAPPLPSPAAHDLVRIVVLTVLTCALAAATLRLQEFPPTAQARVAAGLLLLGLGSAVDGALALATGLLGAVLLAGTAAAVLNQAIDAEKQQNEELRLKLQAVESGLREDRARLHEINATVAGIASAQKLMTEGLTGDRHEALTSMMRAEVERLQRLVADRVPSGQRSVDLDEVIGQIVLSHLARGRVVVWHPSGLRAMGRADDIAEVVNVLLENAAVHGGPDAVTVGVSRDPDGQGVTVTVSDQGPGIPPELRERLFDWGVSRPDSPGQGIGLHIAADITHELGGVLELLPTAFGATFAMHLPAVPQEASADERVARAS
jgi:signal transduction histidine kinase